MGTDFLFARPSFLSGLALGLDIGATANGQYNSSATPNEADYRAIKSDWAVAGMDIRQAMETAEKDEQK